MNKSNWFNHYIASFHLLLVFLAISSIWFKPRNFFIHIFIPVIDWTAFHFYFWWLCSCISSNFQEHDIRIAWNLPLICILSVCILLRKVSNGILFHVFKMHFIQHPVSCCFLCRSTYFLCRSIIIEWWRKITFWCLDNMTRYR